MPPFTAQHERLRAQIREFVLTRLRPHADEWEAAGWFPNQVFGWLAEGGYLGLKFPARYGGGDDPVAAVLVEELARCGSGGVAAGLGAHAGIALPPILAFGTDDQKQRYLVPGLRGELIAALAITEPSAGSDVASIRTHARRVPADTWSTAPRPTSPVACAPTSRSPRCGPGATVAGLMTRMAGRMRRAQRDQARPEAGRAPGTRGSPS